jgi:hypothetical protein
LKPHARRHEEDVMPAHFRRAVPPALTGPESLALATLLTGLVVFGLLLWLLPAPLILPALSALLIAAACAVAILAWRAPRLRPAQLGYWDLAGALTFIGIVAALLGEPDQALPLLQGAPPQAE